MITSSTVRPTMARMIARYALVSVGAAVAVALVITSLIGMIGGDLFRSATLFAIVAVPVFAWTVGGALALVAVAVGVGLVVRRVARNEWARFAVIWVVLAATSFLALGGAFAENGEIRVDTVAVLVPLVAASCLALAAVYPWRGGFAAEFRRSPTAPESKAPAA